MDRLVVDASVAAKWMIREQHSDHADRLREPGYELIAPDFLYVELTNVVRNWVRSGVLPTPAGEALVRNLTAFNVELFPAVALLSAALELSIAHERSAYDALYVALALREGCQLLTADLRLHNALKDALPETMLWIGDI